MNFRKPSFASEPSSGMVSVLPYYFTEKLRMILAALSQDEAAVWPRSNSNYSRPFVLSQLERTIPILPSMVVLRASK